VTTEPRSPLTKVGPRVPYCLWSKWAELGARVSKASRSPLAGDVRTASTVKGTD